MYDDNLYIINYKGLVNSLNKVKIENNAKNTFKPKNSLGTSMFSRMWK